MFAYFSSLYKIPRKSTTESVLPVSFEIPIEALILDERNGVVGFMQILFLNKYSLGSPFANTTRNFPEVKCAFSSAYDAF